MGKIFNVSADCHPDLHYMVDLKDRLEKITAMVDAGQYFTINRARQYGKTTTLLALAEHLKKEHTVVSLDFQLFSAGTFRTENTFSLAFAKAFARSWNENQSPLPDKISRRLHLLYAAAADKREDFELQELFENLSGLCLDSKMPVVLLIDEVDSAANNQVFLDFLSQLRGYYIKRRQLPVFQSVILASVYDIKNLQHKFINDREQKFNSPWNIAADFLIDMNFSQKDIIGMLNQYEEDHNTGMNIEMISGMLHDYTSGYPFLVSRICKLLDERIAGSIDFPDKHSAWSKQGFLEAVSLLLKEKNTLFDSLVNKLADDPRLRKMLYSLLFAGKSIPYTPLNQSISVGEMFGFIRQDGDAVVIANRIFETLLYNLFLSDEFLDDKIYDAALNDKNQFIENGHLNMRLVLEKFVKHFDDLYGDQKKAFYEDDGRRYFLLYLRPIINGTGNYYIEAQTRNRERTDVIVDYRGEQFIIELKLWRGNSYHTRGEQQLLDYLNYYHLDKGYMLSFNFNKEKQTGIREITLNGKVLVEAVV